MSKSREYTNLSEMATSTYWVEDRREDRQVRVARRWGNETVRGCGKDNNCANLVGVKYMRMRILYGNSRRYAIIARGLLRYCGVYFA
jgi:hypothetical protein